MQRKTDRTKKEGRGKVAQKDGKKNTKESKYMKGKGNEITHKKK